MTKIEFEERINAINNDINASPEAKKQRIEQMNAFYSKQQSDAVETANNRKQAEEAQLKSRLKAAYMVNPAATEEDFESDYPQLKSDFLRGEALQKDAFARQSQSAITREAF